MSLRSRIRDEVVFKSYISSSRSWSEIWSDFSDACCLLVCGVSTLSTKTVVPSCSREGEINGVGEVT